MGFADLAIGVPNDSGVHVLHGSAAGLQGSGNGGPEDQLLRGDIAGENSARSLASGNE